MRISQIEEKLAKIKKKYGDIQCLIEIEAGYAFHSRNRELKSIEVEECSVERRNGFGMSVMFLA